MAEQIHLNQAPIIEAIIEFRVNLPKSFDPSQLQQAKVKLQDDYPLMETRNSFLTKLEVKSAGPEVSTDVPKLLGYFFKSADEKHIAQFRIDGFAFSRMKPYTNWPEVLNEARRLWNIYIELCSPVNVNRVAIRYINSISIPAKQFELEDYFTAPPQPPPAFSAMISSFRSQLLIHDLVRNVSANVTLASIPRPTDRENSIFTFDIDAFKEGNFLVGKELFDILDSLHASKNDIFFKSITDKIVEIYK